MSDEKVIPINRAMVQTLSKLLEEIGDQYESSGPIDILLIDDFGLMKLIKWSGRMVPVIKLNKFPARSFLGNCEDSFIAVPHEVKQFVFSRKIGNVFEYREKCEP